MRSMSPALYDALDLAIDLATLGEYGLAPPAQAGQATRSSASIPAAIHRVCPDEGRTAAALGAGPDPRIAPATPAARRRVSRRAAPPLAAQALERQRRLGTAAHARRGAAAIGSRPPAPTPSRPPAPVAYIDDARRHRRARRHAAGSEQLALDFVA